MPRLLLLALLLFTATTASFAARVDTLAIPSAAMHKTYRAAVVLPTSYAKNKKAHYPVLYLLHGAYGHFADWLKSTPDKQLVHNLADQYNIIIVLPEGETFSFYLDSPVSPDSQFETYLTKEVLPKIDQTYRTVADRKGRVIAGLSMGGHGALYLSARHPDLYYAAGSMSGALDLMSLNRKLSPADVAQRVKLWAPILGSEADNPERFAANSVMGLVDQIQRNKLPLIIDCGVDDGLIDINRELHRRLVYNHTPHDYTERPGAHTWEYWQNALPYQLLFFQQVLKQNGVTVL
ncbi:alpha/beta hydrolase family protein [Hymenobacter sp. BT770]|uniref:alpha/beta hydrolase n=1 Tax=Hymenobacter sp. BT770 TaxID=2886942 RepID=UPI001D1254FB|nr:alpha/beta hydrolase family protein [Hymenobacter sp. BT770]MCC3152446.1 esterase family protein [Hymenobacter sp. BT770]MDO3414578.1 alpha/beta hydrolase family protein [Hymenobacter sp. BT770]